ncbi:hypothetical protein KJW59_17075, partial [Enterococcus faecium]|nr:hypothetical protein [Enterococcus faecium]MBT1022059.1 hypothetical protein [Enterococcus faecium]
NLFDQSINQSKITKNLSQNEVHSDPDLILYNPSVLIDKEPKKIPPVAYPKLLEMYKYGHITTG